MARSVHFSIGDLTIEVNGDLILRFPSNTSVVQDGFLLIPAGTPIFSHQGFLLIPRTAVFSDHQAEGPMLPDNNANIIDMVEDAESFHVFDEEAPAEWFDDDGTTASRLRPASKTAIEGLEKVRIDDGRVGHCAVCLEGLLIGDEVRRLPCSHLYHPDCIVKWLKSSNKCPLCRHQMPVVDFDLNSTPPALDCDLNCKCVADFDSNDEIFAE